MQTNVHTFQSMVTEEKPEHASSDEILHSGFAFGPGMVYTSAGVNRRPESVACSLTTGLVYFASHNGVLIYDPSSTRYLHCKKCIATLSLHNVLHLS